jgi:hypothetical protein
MLRDLGIFILLMKTLFFELSHAVINSSWCCCVRTVLSVVLQNKFPERTGVKNGQLTLGVSVGEPGLVPLYGLFAVSFVSYSRLV